VKTHTVKGEMLVPYYSAEDIAYFWDLCYDAGFDDGWAGAPPTGDLGDLTEPYLFGYADGRNSREVGGTP